MGNLSTPKSVQKLQMALHAKAKAEAGYRFYALYDKMFAICMDETTLGRTLRAMGYRKQLCRRSRDLV